MTGAREKMFQLLTDSGWVLDPTRTYSVGAYRYGRNEERTQAQHPGYWIKDAEQGGVWKLYLDYEVPNGYSTRFDNRLRRVCLEREVDGEVVVREYLNTPSRSRYYRPTPSALYVALGDGEYSLRERTERLVTNPELALWLAAEVKHKRTVRAHQRAEESRINAELRARPLPITVEQAKWKQLTGAAVHASTRLQQADGTSDVPALLDELRAAVTAIESVVQVPAAV